MVKCLYTLKFNGMDKKSKQFNFDLQAGFSLRAFKGGSQGLPMWIKGALDYDTGVCCFKEVKTIAKIQIIFVFY